ncbi:MAG TPA: HlyD family efflux transporter periplasmic adaptor subunit [Phycisphaerae bacterium]|jgi:HlyD family secretion protein|nr:HlyD family efflux transporter periplasmic adaptor subunit [Phycisphaerae bacterium]
MKYFVIFIVLAVILGGGGWLYLNKMKAANATSTAVQDTDTVKRRTIEKIVSANGKVASNRDVDIKCQASGTIKTLPYKDVSKEVKPGEMLCELDPVDMQRLADTAKFVVDADDSRIAEAKLNWNIAKMSLETTRQRTQATLASARAQAADAHAKAERTRQLFESKPTALASKEELDTANTSAAQMDANVLNAQAAIAELDQQKIQIDTKEQQIKQMELARAQDNSRYETALQNVKYCTVYAPKADDVDDPPRWFITSLLTNIAPGYVVQSGTSGFSAGTTIMTLSDLSHIFVLASVDESDYEDLKDPEVTGVRQKVRITADSFQDQAFEGEIVRIAKKGVNVSNVVTFEVKIEVTSPNRTLLRPEMTATVNIICDSRTDVLAIPASDVRRTGSAVAAGPATAAATASDAGMTPADTAAAAASQPATATGTAPTNRGGRGGRGGGGRGGRGQGGGGVAAGNKGPSPAVATVLNAAGKTEQRNIVIGLMGTDPTDSSSGDLYEVVSGLNEGDEVVRQNGQESRFRSPNAGQAIQRLGGGGGRGR